MSETKYAKFNKKHKSLLYWTSRNTIMDAHCDDRDRAKALVKSSGIKQTLRVS